MSYKDVEIPEGLDATQYTHMQRRAEILRVILEAGHPDAISTTTLAKRYGVSNGMISKDKAAILKEVSENLGDDVDLIVKSVFGKAIKNLAKSDNTRDQYMAAKLTGELYQLLFDTGHKKKAATELKIESDVVRFSDFADALEQAEQKKAEGEPKNADP